MRACVFASFPLGAGGDRPQSRSLTRPLHALSGRPPAQHRLRSATASTSTHTVAGLARRRPPIGSVPCRPSGARVERLVFSGCSADTSGTARADTITFRLLRDTATGQ